MDDTQVGITYAASHPVKDVAGAVPLRSPRKPHAGPLGLNALDSRLELVNENGRWCINLSRRGMLRLGFIVVQDSPCHIGLWNGCPLVTIR